MKSENGKGTIRKDPKNKNTIKLAAMSCMKDGAFPNHYLQQNVIAQDPDILFFAGDQLYEEQWRVWDCEGKKIRRCSPCFSKLFTKVLDFRVELSGCDEGSAICRYSG